ncbi:MAG: hypothetical protein WAU65_02025 [Candidatus Nanoarchaeia archaeon]
MAKKIYEAGNLSLEVAKRKIELGSNPVLSNELSPYFVSHYDNPAQYSEERIYHLRNFGITVKAQSQDEGLGETKKVTVYAYAGEEKVDLLKLGEVERIINEILPLIR